MNPYLTAEIQLIYMPDEHEKKDDFERYDSEHDFDSNECKDYVSHKVYELVRDFDPYRKLEENE